MKNNKAIKKKSNRIAYLIKAHLKAKDMQNVTKFLRKIKPMPASTETDAKKRSVHERRRMHKLCDITKAVIEYVTQDADLPELEFVGTVKIGKRLVVENIIEKDFDYDDYDYGDFPNGRGVEVTDHIAKDILEAVGMRDSHLISHRSYSAVRYISLFHYYLLHLLTVVRSRP